MRALLPDAASSVPCALQWARLAGIRAGSPAALEAAGLENAVVERRRRTLRNQGRVGLAFVAVVTACATPSASVSDSHSHRCESRIVICNELRVGGPATAACDPETGLVGSCVPPRHESHEGEPCELVPDGRWTLIDWTGGDTDRGVICLPPLPASTDVVLYNTLAQRIDLRPPATIRCGTGSVVPLPDGCPRDAPIVPHDDPPPIPDEAGCTPVTCTSAARDCGIGLDGCGHYLDCGECTTFVEQMSDLVSTAAASPARALIYVSHPTDEPPRIVALSREDLSEQASLDLPVCVVDPKRWRRA
jgi:hypothetical protein